MTAPDAAEHTPGPWRAEGDLIETADGHWIAEAASHHPNYHANARLMAAAPDLLKALKLILPLAKGYSPRGQSERARATCSGWIEAAEAALAKASGGQP